MASFKEKGVPAPKEYFRGTVWVNMNLTADDGYNTMIGTVTFEPKGRTNWHTHTSGQILFRNARRWLLSGKRETNSGYPRRRCSENP